MRPHQSEVTEVDRFEFADLQIIDIHLIAAPFRSNTELSAQCDGRVLYFEPMGKWKRDTNLVPQKPEPLSELGGINNRSAYCFSELLPKFS